MKRLHKLINLYIKLKATKYKSLPISLLSHIETILIHNKKEN